MRFAAGIDGGGTKTTVALRDLQGNALGRKAFGAFNLNSIGPARFSRLLEEITAYLRESGECVSLCIGAAGISNPTVRELTEQAMNMAGVARWKLVGDHEIALYGALEGMPGCALIAGTGSICFGRDGEGNTARAGGWGHLIDDGGSGYALGRDALKALVCAWDGRQEDSLLTRRITGELGIDSRQALIAYVYGGEKSCVAALAPLVEETAAQGDETARRILRDNAKALGELAAAVVKRLPGAVGEVALLGGLLSNDTHLRRETVKYLSAQLPGICPVAPRQDAAAGAALMALELAKQE